MTGAAERKLLRRYLYDGKGNQIRKEHSAVLNEINVGNMAPTIKSNITHLNEAKNRSGTCG